MVQWVMTLLHVMLRFVPPLADRRHLPGRDRGPAGLAEILSAGGAGAGLPHPLLPPADGLLLLRPRPGRLLR